MTFQFSQTIYVADTDLAGVVYHANYIKFMEAARVDMLSRIGYPYHQLQEQHIGLVPIHIDIKYKSPLRLENRFTVHTKYLSHTPAKISFQQDVMHQDTLCTTATITLAAINQRSFKPIRIPENLISKLCR